jgi:radical SAM protein with 4Fe4S-binding SPASM domain
VPINELFKKLLQFVQILHLYNINVVVDGMVNSIEKSYFNDHKQIVLAPDGHLYPEFDFVEYKVTDARIGEWRDRIAVNPITSDNHLTHTRCHECPAKEKCGIKFLYKMWAEKPDEDCLQVSRMYEFIIRHLFKLKETNITEVIGIK